MSQWGAYGLANEGLVAPADPHPLLLRHPRRQVLDAAEGAPRRARGRTLDDPPRRTERPGAAVARRSRGHVRGEDPVREHVDGFGGTPAAQVRDPRRDRHVGRRRPMGWSRAPAVRHVRRHRVPGLRARGRRRLAPGVRLRLRVPRVRSHRMCGPVRGAAHAGAPAREVPPRHGGDAEQLAGRGAADPGRRRPDVRHVQDPAVRAPERLRLSPARRGGRPGLRRVEQGDRRWTATDGSPLWSGRPGRSSGTRAP